MSFFAFCAGGRARLQAIRFKACNCELRNEGAEGAGEHNSAHKLKNIVLVRCCVYGFFAFAKKLPLIASLGSTIPLFRYNSKCVRWRGSARACGIGAPLRSAHTCASVGATAQRKKHMKIHML